MNILHVSLGLPPLRTGGLTRYSTDLMLSQMDSGHRVYLLFPGRHLPGHIRLKSGDWNGINTLELINPLPVALTFGCAEPLSFIKGCGNPGVFFRMLNEVHPDVIHVHSYMGIYKEFFVAAKDMDIPLLFTTHDYYPICPRCTFIDADDSLCVGPIGYRCEACCRNGMTLRKSIIMQSGFYSRVKGLPLVRQLGNKVKKAMREDRRKKSKNQIVFKNADNYDALLQYNSSIMSLFDVVLANSKQSEEIYRAAYPSLKYKLFNISHSGLSLKANFDLQKSSNDIFTIGYFGGRKSYKGYETLMDAVRVLHECGIKFKLNLYGDEYASLQSNDVYSCGIVPAAGMQSTLRQLDLVIVPSICPETFGFTVLESLCERVSVICSDNVGAKDLVGPDACFPAGDSVALAKLIMSSIERPSAYNESLKDYPLSMEQQVVALNHVYRKSMR